MLRLKELGHAGFRVYDRASHVGGLAASFVDAKGFTWDVGGHVQFSHYRYFDRLMDEALGPRWLTHERESWVWIEGRFVPYPFQNNIRHLTTESRWRCVKGLVELYKQPPTGRPKNFRQWIDATFGEGIAGIFMVPYNFKVWAYPLEEMDYNWIGERVAVTDLTKVLDNVLHEKDDLSWGPNNTFRFPEYGGTGMIWEKVANLVGRESISLGKEVSGIDPGTKTVHFCDGSRDSYDALVSTLPIDRLVDLAGFDALKPAASAPQVQHVVHRGSGTLRRASRAALEEVLDVLPREQLPVLPGNRVLQLLAQQCARPVDAVVADGRGVRVDPQAGGSRPGGRLDDQGHARNGPDRRVARDPLEMVVPGRLRLPDPVARARRRTERHPPYAGEASDLSRGRFGGWKYEVSNQDHSLMQGVELVDRLALGVPEVTYWFPNTANDMQYARLGRGRPAPQEGRDCAGAKDYAAFLRL